MFHLEAGTLHHNYQQPKLSGTGLRGFLGERSCLFFFFSVFAEQYVRVWGSKRVRGVFVGGRAKLGGWSALQSGWVVSWVTGSDRRYRSSLDCCRALVTWRVVRCRRERTAGGS